MISRRSTFLRYVLFAAVATGTNVAAQVASLRIYDGAGALAASLLVGTGVGFAVKYVLDKQFIFFDRIASAAGEFAKVSLYAMTAVATTLVFWTMELGFLALWHTSTAKYLGGALGLGLGYSLKYLLDRRFVFGRGAAQ